MKKRIGVIAGSFDPITNGHVWLIEQALGVVDKLFVVIGNNPAKKYLFSETERIETLDALLDPYDTGRAKRIFVTTIDNQMLVNWAADAKATHLIRGIRNPQDFEYEHTMQLINKKMHPEIETIFFIPPRELTEVSSSTVKSIVGFDGWKDIVKSYVDPLVMDKLEEKYKAKQ